MIFLHRIIVWSKSGGLVQSRSRNIDFSTHDVCYVNGFWTIQQRRENMEQVLYHLILGERTWNTEAQKTKARIVVAEASLT